MKMTNPRTPTSLLVATAFCISACGSGESSGSPQESTDRATPRTTSVVNDPIEPPHSGASDDADGSTSAGLADALAVIVADTGVPALGAAVFDHDGLIDQDVAGLRERNGETAVTVADLFHLGSNTKAMTAALLARLDEQGGPVGFDTTLAEVFVGDAP